MNNISIVIPIYNRLLLTQRGIQSLHNSLDYYQSRAADTQYSFSIVVVDDGSTDGSSEWIAEQYPTVHLLKGDGNLWWTGAVNKGSRHAVEELNADFVLLWNDDTLCDISYFVELSTLLTRDSTYRNSILASKIYWVDESNILFNYGCYYSNKTGKKKLIGVNQKDSGQFSDIIPIDWSGGMGTIIPAKILKEVGYFDAEHFPQYHGDLDFFLRAGKKGYSSFAVPTLKIYNNRDSTGVSTAKSFADLKKILLSNRSHYNIRHNFLLNQRHANTVLSWGYFLLRYFGLVSNSLRTMVLS
jgi:GT2 family glycosyltransferase